MLLVGAGVGLKGFLRLQALRFLQSVGFRQIAVFPALDGLVDQAHQIVHALHGGGLKFDLLPALADVARVLDLPGFVHDIVVHISLKHHHLLVVEVGDPPLLLVELFSDP